MKKFYLVTSYTQYYWVDKYKTFKTEEEANQYVKDSFLIPVRDEQAAKNWRHMFKTPYHKEFQIQQIFYDHELFNFENVSIEPYWEFEYHSEYEQYAYNPKHNGLPHKISDALTNRGKNYIEVSYATTEDGKFYDGDEYFNSLEELKEANFKEQSKKYAEQYYKY